MLEIEIPEETLYDEKTMTFIPIKATKLRFEHSLVSISKWESKWHKPYLDDSRKKTSEEMIDYLKCMCLTQNVDPEVFKHISSENMKKIAEYMEDPQTATWFNDKNQPHGNKKVLTNELIYYWMAELGIWKECEKWHIKRLLTLIHVCSAEKAPKKKMSKGEVYERHRALNAARRKSKKPH